MKTTICFVKRNPQVREYKQAVALKRTGRYRLILLAHRYDYSLFKDVFDEIIDYGMGFNKVPDAGIKLLGKRITPRNVLSFATKMWGTEEAARERLAKLVRKTEADIFHAHAEPNIIPRIVMENTDRPVIYDAYDYSGLRFGLDKLPEIEREAERFALENASGIVTKFNEKVIQYYRAFGYNINCPTLEFRDYCQPEFCVSSLNTGHTFNDGFHLVYTGVVESGSLPRRQAGNNQIINIALRIIQPGLSFHIYPNPWQYSRTLIQDYFDAADNNPQFSLHEPVRQHDLQLEISKYHYGCNIHDFSGTAHTKEFEETSIGVKLFTYLEAGLPVIVSSNLKLNAQVVTENKVGVVVDLADLEILHKILQDVDYASLKKNVLEARKGQLCMDNNITRLEKFYSQFL
ncbi:MAG: hypothetical protein HYX79_00295 [Chloroflexi bacterium]|nr:hypothetical protein [Chloroflexota bacterium]